eukprot:CAMPEP_0115549862 /NCGR_PEP_ID=MMETSP0271-20121206/94921_1 /TAXON_ID=71861 /ORGANISM="Scrippsiella trochoidea, Strain CCMP3099" /LENGTH=58 /DNA_ID=CAMNT_0002983419 /DNA_START=218 /DNA_END=391 /DNA_ORIENTATION=-
MKGKQHAVEIQLSRRIDFSITNATREALCVPLEKNADVRLGFGDLVIGIWLRKLVCCP